MEVTDGRQGEQPGASEEDELIHESIWLGHSAVFRGMSNVDRFLAIGRVLFMLAQTCLAIIALRLGNGSQCVLTYNVSLVMNAGMFLFVLLMLPRYLMLLRSDDPQPRQQRQRKLVANIDFVFLAVFLCGTTAIFSDKTCVDNSPLTFWSLTTLVLIELAYILSPFIYCILFILFLPCIIVIARQMHIRANNVFDGRMGAPLSVINAIPIVKYRIKRVIPDASPTSPDLVESPAVDAPNEPIVTDKLDQPVDIQQASSSSQSQHKLRKFHILPGLFKPRNSEGTSSPSISSPRWTWGSPQHTGPKNDDRNVIEIEQEDAVCVICLGEYDDGESLKQLSCKHHFHIKCIDDWLKLNAKCPLCIKSLVDDDSTND